MLKRAPGEDEGAPAVYSISYRDMLPGGPFLWCCSTVDDLSTTAGGDRPAPEAQVGDGDPASVREL